MQFWKLSILAPAIILAAACNRNDRSAAADSALRSDLSLANQVSPRTDSVSAIESGYAPAPAAASNLRAASGTRSASSATRRTTSTRTTPRRRTSSGGSSGTVTTTSGGNVSTSAPAPTVVKHTKRDAAIGAAAGAVIGATTSRNRVKGAVIGGVVGGVLGAVIGNNVDKTKKP